MRKSLYWDDFELRISETLKAIKENTKPKVRRVAVFITNKCNFRCAYCNTINKNQMMTESKFEDILDKYGKEAIIHITGGEPSMVPWLYSFIIKNGDKYRFHLNTNAYIQPPSGSIKRLKISLDHYKSEYWDRLVNKKGAFDRVIKNIKDASNKTLVSLTYTLTKENYKDAANFVRFIKQEVPNLYAIFFSVYKGNNINFQFNKVDAYIFFNSIYPELEDELNEESLNLIKETLDEKSRLIIGIRFPENDLNEECYLSMSERVFSPNGDEYCCSHLYRDNIFIKDPIKHNKCLYGCNRRLIKFNQEISNKLKD